jgi:hypothetical protein
MSSTGRQTDVIHVAVARMTCMASQAVPEKTDGTTAPDYLCGGPGNGFVSGNSGNDLIDGGDGKDFVLSTGSACGHGAGQRRRRHSGGRLRAGLWMGR